MFNYCYLFLINKMILKIKYKLHTIQINEFVFIETRTLIIINNNGSFIFKNIFYIDIININL